MRALALALVVCLSPAAAAEDGMRCGQRLVSVGEREPAVLAKCGAPTYATTRRVTTSDGNYAYRTVVVDEWTYDRGPSEFVRTLEFIDGVLRYVEVGGYGH